IKKVGVERRVYAAGANKDRLDPFLPQNKEDVIKVESVINEIHNNFIQTVKKGRKDKLHGHPKELFSGDFWSGETALKLGLVDGLGDLSDVLHNEFNVSGFKDYSQQQSVIKALMNQLGMALNVALTADDRVHVLEKI